ncbi:uncharacterized protein PHALS_15014 [Plasmopara halstedii]|uniref:Uncharacterized protein n=1 Tax=Plasmopara halstedii TaxID=4781 RepID=A0A0P1A957_PLAHL|nr:uncharacterized protein PHALS_15014 [Plasmopara halstedii]CEG37052.1 hypothetical protein PHALS_15014 [Plasmopara halstedii]|eukprot:XP_024573421.1 hypothetical protein PHALS_15014 [Plasmopara halstedii]
MGNPIEIAVSASIFTTQGYSRSKILLPDVCQLEKIRIRHRCLSYHSHQLVPYLLHHQFAHLIIF